MSWVEVAFEVKSDQVESASELLEQLGALAVTCYDAKDTPIFEPPPLSEPIIWEDSILVGLMEATCSLDHIQKQLLQAFPQTQITSKKLEDRNWVTYVQSKFPAQQYGKLWVAPSWAQVPPGDDQVVLALDPGVAFGTGTHATTYMCLDWISQHDFRQQTVVDFGCGSGILGLAAALLGAEKVFAIDHCPQAVQATISNRDKNHIGEEVLTVTQDAKALQSVDADCVVANILAGPLISLRDEFLKVLRPGGNLVLSGLLTEQVPQIKAHYQAHFDWISQTDKDDWSLLQLKRKCHD